MASPVTHSNAAEQVTKYRADHQHPSGVESAQNRMMLECYPK